MPQFSCGYGLLEPKWNLNGQWEDRRLWNSLEKLYRVPLRQGKLGELHLFQGMCNVCLWEVQSVAQEGCNQITIAAVQAQFVAKTLPLFHSFRYRGIKSLASRSRYKILTIRLLAQPICGISGLDKKICELQWWWCFASEI